MLVIEAAQTVWRELRRLPLLSRIGLAIMASALVADVVMRLAPTTHQHMGHRPDEHLAHVVALAAMVLVIAGVIADAARRHRSRRRSSHAHR